MLEKIGLPAKPSMRGSNWVVDASHCQGCSSQFTFINRKHHCRRCGGIFCSSCTQQRMILRGQGDSPVRICEPCKKLEEAARFEMRHGHKNRTSRGGPNMTAKHEDEVLNQILGTAISDSEKGTMTASSSSFNEAVSPSVNTQNDATEENHPRSPEELLQLSLEEKKKYRTLKGEGKPEEALRAFKRGKELERQAKALEVKLRKNSRKPLSSNSLAGKTNDDSQGFVAKSKLSSHVDKEEKNDISSELRELGWSDADLHDADKKPVQISLESELSSLLGVVHKSSGVSKGTGSIDRAQVIALKKKALGFKREGKLAEAKEELKKAKLLEKKLEEQEFLVEAEDSDDELSSLIHSMDDDKKDDFSLLDKEDTGFDFNHLLSVSDDLGLDGNFEVTEEDMEDPEIVATLESLGWTEDSEHPVAPETQSVPVDARAVADDILALKKEAVQQKRSGNVEEAMTLLRKAKVLERDAENLQSQGNNFIASNLTSEKLLTSQASGSSPSMEADDGMDTSTHVKPKVQPKSKLMIQRELLALKKRALGLKREGQLDEAEEELRKGKVLECQLEEMESGSRVRTTKLRANNKVLESVNTQPGASGAVILGDEDDEADVTEQDMQDPAMLKMLESLGWKDEDRQNENVPPKHSSPSSNHSEDAVHPLLQSTSGTAVTERKRSKAEIQRELLSLKRKALTLRRQGETEEAEEELRKAKLLESQLEETEVSKKESLPKPVPTIQEALGATHTLQESQIADAELATGSHRDNNSVTTSISTTKTSRCEDKTSLLELDPPAEIKKVVEHGGSFPQSGQSVDLVDLLTGDGWRTSQMPVQEVEQRGSFSTSLNNPNKAMQSKDEFLTKNEEKFANRLEKAPVHESNLLNSQNSPSDLSRDILARKRKAVALKREGKLAEAREELRQAKLLEKSLQEDKPQLDAGSTNVIPSTSTDTSSVQEECKTTQPAPKPLTGRDRFKLQQESLGHKRQALKLRREGRTEEADAEFELAKALESQLEESSGGSSSHSKSSYVAEGINDLGVEDLLDPQLLSALTAIGMKDAEIVEHNPDRPEATKSNSSKRNELSQEKKQLEELIKAEKVKAVNLKKTGKQAEALDALRRAKMYEKKLNTLP